MYARTRHFLDVPFSRHTRTLQNFLATFLIVITSLPVLGEPPIVQDTIGPNSFWFSSDTYTVDEDATNAIITVEFSPGDRSWSGSVDYSISNGTAIAGEDYTGVSGTLTFSGPGPAREIIIPIHKDALREGDETVQLFLWNPNAILVRSNATLTIINKNQNPKLRIASCANDSIALEWPSEYSHYVLEKTSNLSSGNWNAVLSSQDISNGVCRVVEACSALPALYRLKKPASP